MKTSSWHHPAVRQPHQLARGERAADMMKRMLATWTALVGMFAVIVWWVVTGGGGMDRSPYFRLNLTLSAFAGLQCFVLLIANKRGEQVAAEIAQHTYDNSEAIKTLLEENTNLTRHVDVLTAVIHDHIAGGG